MKRSFFIFIVVLIATGVFLRFHNLAIPDLTTDEAQYALPATAAHPPLGIALYQGTMAIFGRELLTFRLVAAIVGTVTLALMYLLAQELQHQIRRGVARYAPTGNPWAFPLFATALAALFPPHILFSRLGYLDSIQCVAWLALLLFFLKAYRLEKDVKEEPHSLLGKVLTRFQRKNESQKNVWLIFTFLASIAATMVKGQGLLFPLLLLAGLLMEKRRNVFQSPLAWTLVLSLIPIGFYFLAHPEILATVLLYTGGAQGGMYGVSNPLGRVLELIATWWHLFPLALLLTIAACFSKKVRTLPWPFYLLTAIFIAIPFLLGPDHPYYTAYLVIPTSILIALALVGHRSLIHMGVLTASLSMALLVFPPFGNLQTPHMEPSHREIGYWNAHADAINAVLKGEEHVTVLGYPGHTIRWYLEAEVLVGRRMELPYPTRFILVPHDPALARTLGNAVYEDEQVTVVRQ